MNDCSEAACPDIYIASPPLKFTITDKTSNHDLFFGAPPAFRFQDLVVFKFKKNNDTVHVPFYFIDSLNGSKHIEAVTNELANTLFIQIQNLKSDTVDMIIKPVLTHCCLSSYIIESIKFNGKLICNDYAFSTIVDIKK